MFGLRKKRKVIAEVKKMENRDAVSPRSPTARPKRCDVIPGISSLTQVISDFRNDAIVMRQLDGPSYVSVDKDGNVDIDGNLLNVHCPSKFLKLVTMAGTLDVAGMFTYTAGMTGSGGESGVASIIAPPEYNAFRHFTGIQKWIILVKF